MNKLKQKINIMLGCLLLTNLLLLYAIGRVNRVEVLADKNREQSQALSLSDDTQPIADGSRYAIKIVLFEFN